MSNSFTDGEYAVEQLTPSVWAIDSAADESMYLVKGSRRSVMIDTGSADESPLPLAERLCGTRPELALTHAHFDHMYHADAFETVYLHEKDIAAWRILRPAVWLGCIGAGKKLKRFPVRSYKALKDGDTIDLGDKSLRVVDAAGHTPGSAAFVDEADKLLFTGDAFGSGAYAWMWMPGCLCLSQYKASLTEMLRKLEPFSDYRLLGGHRRQGSPSDTNPHAHELTLDTARDMIVLCEKILKGEAKPELSERNFGVKTDTYYDGLGGIVLTDGKIR